MTTNAINTIMPVYQGLTSTTNAVVTCGTQMPRDDSIPQSGEGDQVLTVTITPFSATSKLFIEFSAPSTQNPDTTGANVALFQDATANALSACSYRGSYGLYLNHFMTSGTAIATTFKIRVGKDNAGGTAVYINGDNAGNRLMGGVSIAYIKVTEYLIM